MQNQLPPSPLPRTLPNTEKWPWRSDVAKMRPTQKADTCCCMKLILHFNRVGKVESQMHVAGDRVRQPPPATCSQSTRESATRSWPSPYFRRGWKTLSILKNPIQKNNALPPFISAEKKRRAPSRKYFGEVKKLMSFGPGGDQRVRQRRYNLKCRFTRGNLQEIFVHKK